MSKIHMMGIGGSGMAAVAYIANKMGYEVSGCDIEASTAYSKNIVKGHNPEHLKDIDYLVVTPAIFYQDSKNAELIEGQKRGIAMTWQEFVGKLLVNGKKLICIAGTHGKSTTTAMAGKLLIDAGMDPTVLVGARVPEWNGNARYGKGEYFIIEADEFNNNFLNYHPDIIVLNNIEFDHPDFFKNEKEVQEAFEKFISNLRGEKILITQKDNPHKIFNLKVYGEHNQANANMVFALGKILGIDEKVIIESLESFRGIGRRTELIADREGIKIFDDYAHHPTAIKTTLEGIREAFPHERIMVVDEPHGFARTKALLNLYKGAFDAADKVLIGPIFKARDMEDFGMTPKIIAEASNHKNAKGYDSFDSIIKELEGYMKPGDIIVVMGAGKSYQWAREIEELLPVSFADLTTFRVGGTIDKYFEVKNEKEIDEAVSYADKNKLPIFIIGGGSDILVSDKKYKGVVIKFTGNEISITGEEVEAQGGTVWDEFVEETVKNNLQGIESLSGIPGTVGASPIQNIGAYGHELSETFESLNAYDIDKKEVRIFTKDDCKFGYRESIFKNKNYWQKFIIISVKLKLKKNGKPGVGYESLKDHLKAKNPESPTIQEIREAVLKVRKMKLEDPKVTGNAGSFFKNPVISSDIKEKLVKKFPDIQVFPFENGFKVSAGWLIEKAGWKGKSFGDAGVSTKHALILINRTGHAKAKEIMDLSQKIIDDVEIKFGIKLEREVQLINF